MKVTYNGLLNGFAWFDKHQQFRRRRKIERLVRNYHVVLLKDKWAVHGEGESKWVSFPTRDEAVTFATQKAMSERTEFFVHRLDGSIEKNVAFSSSSYPQEEIFPDGSYPKEVDPGEFVL